MKNIAGQNKPRRKRMHLPNFPYSGGSNVYFLTLCTQGKNPYFSENAAADIIVNEIKYRSKAGEAKIFCFCIMPDHSHMLMSLSDTYPKNLQNWVSAFKRYTSRTVNEALIIRHLWQKNFYDHVVRKEESLIGISEYILNNPVRKGLVSRWNEYPYSRMLDPLPV